VSTTGEKIEVTVIGILDTGLHEIDTAAFYIVLDDAKSLDPIFYFYSFVLVTTVFASLFPARRDARLKPVETLRYVL